MAIKALEQEPCEDCISRQAAIDACDQSINLFEAVDRIKELTPVTPQPKMGHWLYSGENGADRWTCDNCFDFVEKPTKICPNCGVKMESEG
jgi:hypothetical protein